MATTWRPLTASFQVVSSTEAHRILGANMSSIRRSHKNAETISSSSTSIMVLRKEVSGNGSSCTHLFSCARRAQRGNAQQAAGSGATLHELSVNVRAWCQRESYRTSRRNHHYGSPEDAAYYMFCHSRNNTTTPVYQNNKHQNGRVKPPTQAAEREPSHG